MITVLGEIDKHSKIDLKWLDIGITRDFIATKVGQPKFITARDVLEDDTVMPFKWKNIQVYNYEFEGVVVRVIYDKNKSANSIFIGPTDKPSTVKLNNLNSWTTKQQDSDASSTETVWSKLRFSDIGDPTRDQRIHTGASASLVAIVCPYTYYPPGGSTYDQKGCFISAGASDGAFGVSVVDNQADISESEVSDLAEKKQWNDQKIRQWVWDKIKDKAFNYMMISCDDKLILDSW